MQDISLFKKKLVGYSVMAGVVIACSKESDAQIIYTDVNPDEIVGAAWSYLDLDNDSVFDFRFKFENNGSYCPASNAFAVALNTNYLLRTYSSSVAALNLSDSILQSPSNMFWAAGEGMLFSYDCLTGNSDAHTCEDCSADGPWHSAKDKFMGIILHESDGNHYGWIRMTDGEILKDYAYQSQPDISIMAGQFDSADTLQVVVTPFGSISVCTNTTVQLTVNAGPPYSIQWQKNGCEHSQWFKYNL